MFTDFCGTTASCCVTEHDSQVHSVLCVETGREFIWSPSEVGTFEAANTEHDNAHRAVHQRARDAQSAVEYHFSWCRLIQCPQHDYLLEQRDAARDAAQGVSR